MLAACGDLHVLRDPTRGGLAASLNEIARASKVGIELVEQDIPVPQMVRDACGLRPGWAGPGWWICPSGSSCRGSAE